MLTSPASPRAPTSLAENIDRDGFLLLNEFLDAGTVRDAITALNSLHTDSNAARLRRDVAFARRNLLEFGFVRALTELSPVQTLLDSISPGVVPVRAILFDKNPAANWTVPWHQDRSIAVRERIDIPGFGPWSVKAGIPHVQPPQEILQQMLTLRFHLDPCGPDNGPLRVIPATHHRILGEKELEQAVALGQQTHCTIAVGGVVMMRPLILHASSPSKAPSHRRVIHVEFGPAKLPAGLEWAANSELAE